MEAHIFSELHKQCLTVHRLSKFSREQVKVTASMNRLTSKQQRKLSKTRRIDRLWGDLKRPGFPVAGSVCVGEAEKWGGPVLSG